MVRGAFRAIKCPLIHGPSAVTDEALQFLFCQALVWRTPLIKTLIMFLANVEL
jgi:hypothetical protein